MATLDLGVVVAPSADEMQGAPDPQIPTDVLAREIAAHWTVEAPVLGSRAKPVGVRPEPGEPGLYRDAGERVVAIDQLESLPAARALKKQAGAAAIVIARAVAKKHGLKRK